MSAAVFWGEGGRRKFGFIRQRVTVGLEKVCEVWFTDIQKGSTAYLQCPVFVVCVCVCVGGGTKSNVCFTESP